MRDLKICMSVNFLPDTEHRGGVSYQVHCLANKLNADGTDVTVFSSNKPNLEHSYKVNVVKYSYWISKSKILWFGTDKNFKPEYGSNCCGKLDLISTLVGISSCKYFVGFPSVLLYNALYTKTRCHLFTDHQGKEDLRIHDKWKKYLTYDI